jgi:hypothetical protein
MGKDSFHLLIRASHTCWLFSSDDQQKPAVTTHHFSTRISKIPNYSRTCLSMSVSVSVKLSEAVKTPLIPVKLEGQSLLAYPNMYA